VTKYRILLVDDHAIFRQGVAQLLNAEPDLELMHCASVGEALIAVGADIVNLVVLDVNLGNERGLDFLSQARSNGFEGPVLVLTAGLSAHEEELMSREGIAGILTKEAPIEVLAERIREVLGLPEPAHALTQPSGGVDGELVPQFSHREVEVLRAIVEGRLNKEIAADLGYTEATVKAIIRRLFRKTGAQTRSQLVRVALEEYREKF
jgi:DNA-binding NarL/FixJ family response regulator